MANTDYIIKCYSNNDPKTYDFYEKPFKISYIFKKINKKFFSEIKEITKVNDKIEIIRLNNTDFLEFTEDNNLNNISFNLVS